MLLPDQPELNIGVIGHVDHGKTSLVKLLTGKWTDTHSEEIKRGISIKLGYADAAFYKCPKCGEPECYGTDKKCGNCGTKTELARIVSFVDSPGHETLMATMLSGAAVMDGALLLIAANEECPQPQTKEHLMALDVIGVKNIVIVQNKIDLVDEASALKNYEQIKNFVKGTCAEQSPIIPISAHRGVNIDLLIQSILSMIPTSKRDYSKPVKMFVVRSFNINKPGMHPGDLSGGVIGGSLICGSLEVGDEVEIRPGLKIEESNKITWKPVITTVRGLIGGDRALKKVKPGGLIAISTGLDPSITKSDSLVGQVLGKLGTLPEVWHKFTLEIHLLKRIVGMMDEKAVEKIKTNEPLMLNVGSATTVGIVTSARKDDVEVKLKLPVCAEKGQRVAMSRRIGTRWRLIGYGVIK